MATKKYMSLERLQEYDALIKQEIADSVSGKANASHTHDDRYYTESEIDTKLAGKSDTSHTHSNYVPTSRTINGKALSSNITLSASDVDALPNTTIIPSIDGLATEDYVNDVASTKVDKVSGKGLSTNDYTTTEKNKLSGIATGAEVNQNAFSNVVVGTTTIAADSKTDSLTIAAGTGISVSGDATNDKVTITNSGVRSIATGSTNGTISVNTNGTSAEVAVKGLGSAAYTASSAYDAAGTAQTKADAALASAKTYADNAATTVKNDLLNGAGTAYDTLKELGDLIVDNADAIDALETIASGKADATHTHAIADVSGLQTALDGKAASSHGTHVTYSTTAPVMDGTASAGSAATVARSDHRHPTDTSRAAQTDLDSHTSNTTVHITSTERTNWGTAYTHSQAAHAPSNAEKNQNAFSNIKVGSTTVVADTTTDTVEFVGSNVTITPDATNDKITFTVASGSTSAAGIVKLTDSTSSTSTTTAATPKSVKSAYDLANTANDAAAAAQATADGKANASHTHTVANITDLTATATELNYMDGVTSNVQTQLDGKAASGHSHSDATTSAAGFMTAAMVTKLNGIATGANKTTVDSALSSSSTNPVQNKVVNSAITTLTSTVSANTSSISSHSTAISNLQTAVSEIQEITSEEIQALFA